jgi:ribosome-binding factor A
MARRTPGASRPDRVGTLIKELLSQTLLLRSRDPILRRAVITDVRLSGDLSVAKVYWLALDDQTPKDELEAALERSRGYLRTLVGKEIRLRQAPELRFLYDQSVEQGRRIDELLRELAPAAGPADAEVQAADDPEDTAAAGAERGDEE